MSYTKYIHILLKYMYVNTNRHKWMQKQAKIFGEHHRTQTTKLAT
jgi:hypothetical protein